VLAVINLLFFSDAHINGIISRHAVSIYCLLIDWKVLFAQSFRINIDFLVKNLFSYSQLVWSYWIVWSYLVYKHNTVSAWLWCICSAVSSLRCTTPSCTTAGDGNALEGMLQGAVVTSVVSRNLHGGTKKSSKSWMRTAGFRSNIWTLNLENMSQQCWLFCCVVRYKDSEMWVCQTKPVHMHA
jgi:hypothetical protein